MSTTRAYEETLLTGAEEVVHQAVAVVPNDCRDEARLQVLEAASAHLGGFGFDWYRSHLPWRGIVPLPSFDPERFATPLLRALEQTPLPPAMALASLARPPLSHSQKRQEGSYYTDFRLAFHLGKRLIEPARETRKAEAPHIADFASGTGILLVAVVQILAGGDKAHGASLIEHSIHAADLSEQALRGAALSLASLTDSRYAIASLWRHLRQGDSLLESEKLWEDIAPDGFDIIIGNPPWEKLKISRHEWLRANGVQRHYGAEYAGGEPLGGLFADEEGLLRPSLSDKRSQLEDYRGDLSRKYHWQGRGESDHFKLFLELCVKSVRPGGYLALLLPAGLIRSAGCETLRRALWTECESIHFTLFENRARFFAIDTRFKFLSLHARVAKGGLDTPIGLSHATGNESGISAGPPVDLPRAELRSVRPDLSVPEVRTWEEWEIFCRLCRAGQRLGERQDAWKPAILREVDMTQDRARFLKAAAPGAIPILEGRMVHQFRHATKRYVSGSGRSAVWQPLAESGNRVDGDRVESQFWYPLAALPTPVRKRVAMPRVGFCDITGQTNERTMLAARIPPGVVCGNKVPTIIFPKAGEHWREAGDGCLAVANSFAFDWLLRRVVTTTVNFFLLLELPFPPLDPLGEDALHLVRLVQQLDDCAGDAWARAELRAEMDWRVLRAYGEDVATLETMLRDFPLLDRTQPPLPGEACSTITRDFVLWRTAQYAGGASDMIVEHWRGRVERARQLGAVPYVPSHLNV